MSITINELFHFQVTRQRPSGRQPPSQGLPKVFFSKNRKTSKVDSKSQKNHWTKKQNWSSVSKIRGKTSESGFSISKTTRKRDNSALSVSKSSGKLAKMESQSRNPLDHANVCEVPGGGGRTTLSAWCWEKTLVTLVRRQVSICSSNIYKWFCETG